jgi:hypothetical protein
MNKNILAALVAVFAFAMVSCDTPKDLRPDAKVSVDSVEPGTRNTHNIGKVNEVYEATDKQELLPNHDPGANKTLQKGDSIRETEETNTAAGAVRN